MKGDEEAAYAPCWTENENKCIQILIKILLDTPNQWLDFGMKHCY